jgi:hypothetical protein
MIRKDAAKREAVSPGAPERGGVNRGRMASGILMFNFVHNLHFPKEKHPTQCP